MSTQRDYWQECMAIAAEECELTLTPDQRDCLASAAESGHEHYGMAFYSPPPGERMSEIEDVASRVRRLPGPRRGGREAGASREPR